MPDHRIALDSLVQPLADLNAARSLLDDAAAKLRSGNPRDVSLAATTIGAAQARLRLTLAGLDRVDGGTGPRSER